MSTGGTLEQRLFDLADRCDVCGRKKHRGDLVRTNMWHMAPAGENRFSYSEYDSTYHACTVAASSDVSRGARWDESRTSISRADNSISIVQGVTMWDGAGTFRTTDGVDCSGASSLVFSTTFGPYEQDPDEFEVKLGILDDSGSNKDLQRTYSAVRGMERLWFTMSVADIGSPLVSNDVHFYVEATPDTSGSDWWVSELQLEFDKTTPGLYVKSDGSAVNRTVDTRSMTVRKMCPDCWEEAYRISDLGKNVRQETIPWVIDDMQEI